MTAEDKLVAARLLETKANWASLLIACRESWASCSAPAGFQSTLQSARGILSRQRDTIKPSDETSPDLSQEYQDCISRWHEFYQKRFQLSYVMDADEVRTLKTIVASGRHTQFLTLVDRADEMITESQCARARFRRLSLALYRLIDRNTSASHPVTTE
ncbi:MAG: hypothetical protein JWM68_1880 [Verrucomicrobiales bacterium]|nr:hypothetical protein [Verrucomicrobiales bacterium]